ncbi:MAG: ATP-binding protein [Candidatus Woesearchaeota archaeon]
MQQLKVDLQNLIYAMLRQYKNKHVLIREVIQNAVDAGANHVKITISPALIQIEDDGSGMNRQEIEQYWNVIAGTSKREKSGAIGEFGLGRLTLLLVSDRMFMETRKRDESFRVVTDRWGNVVIDKGNRLKQGTRVWVEGDFSEYVTDFIDYARLVAKARAECIEVNGSLVSRTEYSAPKDSIFSMRINQNGIKGVLWIPVEVPQSKTRKKEREATIRLYVNDLFVKDFSTDYYICGEVNCDALKVVTSRDDVVHDEQYEKFQASLLDFIETKFYPSIASNSELVNNARIKNDILKVASKRGDKTLIENMVFQTTSGEKVTGKDILSREKVFVISETNRRDMELGDTFHKLGEGVSVVAPVGLKKTLDKILETVSRDEVSHLVVTLTRGKEASSEEKRQFREVGKLVNQLTGYKVEYRKKITAEAAHSPGKIIINIESPIFREAKSLVERGRKDLAMVRLIGVVAHEMAHELHGVHDVEFYKNFERIVSQLETKIIRLLGNPKKFFRKST